MATKFADTTALFEYHAGTVTGRAEARELLAPKADVASSDHVEREWKRILFTSTRDLLKAVETQPDLSSALRMMGSGYGRAASQRLLALALVCRASTALDVQDIKIRSLQMLRGDARRLYHQTVGDSRSMSQCGLARQEPSQGADGEWQMKITCQRREGICDHEARIGNDLARWRAGAEALAASGNAALRKMGQLAGKMADDPALRTGKNTYGKTGDLAIALDCGTDELLVTTDQSFSVMALAMGFQVHLIGSPAAAQ